MKIIKPKEVGEETAAKAAAEVILAGGIVAYPTETFYALGVRYDDEEALARLFKLKGREDGKPVGLILGGLGMLMKVSLKSSPLAHRLMGEYWPGALTLVLPARKGISQRLAPGGKVAARVPGSLMARLISQEAGLPVTSTSANPSGIDPAYDADSLHKAFSDLSGIDLLIDDGPAPGELPSTIVEVDADGLKILRQGTCMISQDDPIA
ncbi:L-threonylcarbamoyladenylate synthase [Nitrospirota bacterium]